MNCTLNATAAALSVVCERAGKKIGASIGSTLARSMFACAQPNERYLFAVCVYICVCALESKFECELRAR